MEQVDQEAARVAQQAAALLHARHPADAAALLTGALQARGSVLASAASAIKVDKVRMTNLPDLEVVADRCTPSTTAIGIDLHWELNETDAWAYFSFYPDGPERLFTTSTQQELSALCEGRSAPWHGEFSEVRSTTVKGLGTLHRLASELPRRNADRELAAWLILSRFFELVERDIIAPGLRRPRPFLLGSPEWEVAANAVYVPPLGVPRPSPSSSMRQPTTSDAIPLDQAMANLRAHFDQAVGASSQAGAAAIVVGAALGISLLNKLRR